MWLRLSLLFGCGCNQLFDLRETIAIDAAQYDAPIDAPFQCPGPGVAPVFSRLAHQIVTNDCAEYTFSTNPDLPIAVAACRESGAAFRGIEESPLDADQMHPVPELARMTGYVVDQFRLAPEGDEAYARITANNTQTIAVFRRSQDGVWSKVSDLVIPLSAVDAVGSVTRRALGPRLIVQRFDGTFHEYLPDGTGAWLDVQTYATASFSLTGPFDPRITPDGLRLTFTATPTGTFQSRVYYTSRATTMDPFGPPLPIDSVPIVSSPVLTEDCARLYFTSLGSVLWMQQQ